MHCVKAIKTAVLRRRSRLRKWHSVPQCLAIYQFSARQALQASPQSRSLASTARSEPRLAIWALLNAARESSASLATLHTIMHFPQCCRLWWTSNLITPIMNVFVNRPPLSYGPIKPGYSFQRNAARAGDRSLRLLRREGRILVSIPTAQRCSRRRADKVASPHTSIRQRPDGTARGAHHGPGADCGRHSLRVERVFMARRTGHSGGGALFQLTVDSRQPASKVITQAT